MSPQPHDGSAEGLSCTLLRFVNEEGEIEKLREGLGDFSHRCRNLLNGMKMGIYFVRRAGGANLPHWWGEIEQSYLGIERLFDTLQRIYRPMPLTTVRATFGSLARDRRPNWEYALEAGGHRLELLEPAEELAGDFDPICLGMALDGFVRWRARAMGPGCEARIRWRTTAEDFQVEWEEPFTPEGPTLRAECRPGEAGKPEGSSTDELALPLLARVITAHQGHVLTSESRDFSVRLRWPLRVPERLVAPALPAAAPVSSRT